MQPSCASGNDCATGQGCATPVPISRLDLLARRRVERYAGFFRCLQLRSRSEWSRAGGIQRVGELAVRQVGPWTSAARFSWRGGACANESIATVRAALVRTASLQLRLQLESVCR